MTDAHSFFGSQPTFHVDGREDPALAAQLIGLILSETLGEPPRCEATFHNWVEGALVYPDDRTLALTRPLEIRLSGELLFAGQIVTLEGRFPAARPPELRAIAVGPVGAHDAHAGKLQLTHGAALRELYVCVERDASQPTARGVAVPTSGLRVGVHIELEGVGTSFGGEFLVVETRHLFDQSHGLRTEFVATRGGR
ncbi:MAG TPA: hypothetical protein VGB85_11525 [Nannocystis sp.]|jgi:hypothetical protein